MAQQVAMALLVEQEVRVEAVHMAFLAKVVVMEHLAKEIMVVMEDKIPDQ